MMGYIKTKALCPENTKINKTVTKSIVMAALCKTNEQHVFFIKK